MLFNCFRKGPHLKVVIFLYEKCLFSFVIFIYLFLMKSKTVIN